MTSLLRQTSQRISETKIWMWHSIWYWHRNLTRPSPQVGQSRDLATEKAAVEWQRTQRLVKKTLQISRGMNLDWEGVFSKGSPRKMSLQSTNYISGLRKICKKTYTVVKINQISKLQQKDWHLVRVTLLFDCSWSLLECECVFMCACSLTSGSHLLPSSSPGSGKKGRGQGSWCHITLPSQICYEAHTYTRILSTKKLPIIYVTDISPEQMFVRLTLVYKHRWNRFW